MTPPLVHAAYIITCRLHWYMPPPLVRRCNGNTGTTAGLFGSNLDCAWYGSTDLIVSGSNPDLKHWHISHFSDPRPMGRVGTWLEVLVWLHWLRLPVSPMLSGFLFLKSSSPSRNMLSFSYTTHRVTFEVFQTGRFVRSRNDLHRSRQSAFGME